jgi:hypothetical protein
VGLWQLHVTNSYLQIRIHIFGYGKLKRTLLDTQGFHMYQRERERDWINNSGRVSLGGSQTKQAKSGRQAEVVEPRKRLLGRQERGRAMAQGQGDLLVRAVRGAPVCTMDDLHRGRKATLASD